MQSNYYAAKVYAEHPLALWPMDEDSTYISMIKSAGCEDLTAWTLSNVASVSLVVPPPGTPLDEPVYRIVATDPEQPVSLTSPPFLQTDPLPVGMSAYVMNESGMLNSVLLGLIANSVAHGTPMSGGTADDWVRYSDRIVVDTVEEFSIYLEFNAIDNSPELEVYLVGLHVGEFSENYNSLDTGVAPMAVPSSIGPILDGIATSVIETRQYGPSTSQKGYFVVENPNNSISGMKMLARNSGLPMIFGTNHTVSLYKAAGDYPSAIFSGNGFLHGSGRASSYSIEFWMRQGTITSDLVLSGLDTRMSKFFGPVGSDDGLYRDDMNMYLCIGKDVISFPVGNWYRPMLINITYSSASASLYVNGQEVGSINVSNIDSFSDEAIDDWLGFWNFGIDVFEIDCFAIFPYVIPLPLILRRYAVAQGTEELNALESGFGGRSIVFDYTRSNYTTSFSFPNNVSWDRGVLSGIAYNMQTLKFQDLPEPKFIGYKSIDDLVAMNNVHTGDQPSFKLLNSYGLIFSGTMFGYEKVRAVELDFEYAGTDIDIFTVSNNKETLDISVVSGMLTVEYGQTYETAIGSAGRKRILIDLSLIPDINDLYENMTIQYSLPETDTYAVTFWTNTIFQTEYDTTNILSVSEPTGDITIGSYTFCPVIYPNSTVFRIKSRAMWQDTIPLDIFAKKMSEDFFRLDLLQFNTYLDMSLATGYQPRAVVECQFLDSLNTEQIVSKFNSTPINRQLTLTAQDIDNENSYIVDDKDIMLFPQTNSLLNKYLSIRMLLFSDGVQTTTPVSRIDLSSMAAVPDDNSYFGIGTRYGISVYPATVLGQVYSPSINVPIRITRESAPYLRLTEDSGISIVPTLIGNEITNDGNCIAIPINFNDNFKFAGFKTFFLLDEVYFQGITNAKKIAELVLQKSDATDTIELFVEPETFGAVDQYVMRARLNGNIYSNVMFVQDGRTVTYPIIDPMKWTQIAVVMNGFESLLSISYINLFSGATFQNISIHEALDDAVEQKIYYRSWFNVLYPPTGGTQDWVDLSLDGPWVNALQINDDTIQRYYFDAISMSNTTIGVSSIDTSTVGQDINISSDGFEIASAIIWDRDPATLYAAV